MKRGESESQVIRIRQRPQQLNEAEQTPNLTQLLLSQQQQTGINSAKRSDQNQHSRILESVSIKQQSPKIITQKTLLQPPEIRIKEINTEKSISPSNNLRQSNQILQESKNSMTHFDQANENNSQNNSFQDNKSNIYENKKERSKAIDKFKKMGNVVRGLRRLQTNEVKPIDTPKQLEQEIKSFNISVNGMKNDKKNRMNPEIKVRHMLANPNIFSDKVYEMRKTEKFIALAETGSSQDIKKMKKILDTDIKKHIRQVDDDEHLLNRINKFGQTPLYLACKNGNLEVIQFLIHEGANPHKESRVLNDHYESPLEVCVRWNHLTSVTWMLENIYFENDQINHAQNFAITKEMNMLLSSNKKRKSFCCF